MEILKQAISRRRFLQATGVAGAAGVVSVSQNGLSTLSEAQAETPPASSEYTITKSICHQCPARCGLDVYTSNGKVHAVYGNTDHPIANGKLCPKGPLSTYTLYDPDRFKGPMKRTNPKKGRDEDPKFVPISWDEALTTVATRLQNLRDKGESHRFMLAFGRGWGASEVGTLMDFGKLYGSPNIGIGHSSMCSDGSVLAKQSLDGNASYNSYDYKNANYLLMFGAAYLEAFRPLNNNLQQWGYFRGEKTPKTRVTVVDVRTSITAAAADRALLLKPGTDGALALAIAHQVLVNGWWDRAFVGDFKDGVNHFKTGETIDPAAFREKWVLGLIEWWNVELKDRTPKWAASVTTLQENDIVATAREFGTTRPAIALFERGAHTHSNGTLNGAAIHSLNALVGSMFAKGGLGYQMGPSYGPGPAKVDDYLDDYAKGDSWKKPRIDMKGEKDGYYMAKNMLQEVAANHLKGKPYKLDTAMFYLTNPVFSSPQARDWEEALKDMFVIDTSPFPGETSWMADLQLPDHTFLERLQDAPTYPFQGFPIAQLRVPAVKPLYDTKSFGNIVIELGKKMKGPMGEYFKVVDSQENVVRHLAKGFEKDPGDNGVNSFESWKEKGVWFKKHYKWQQRNGEFYEHDGADYNKLMTAAEVKEKLLKTPSGKFEFKSGYLEAKAEWITSKTGRAAEKFMFPHWEAPKYTGGGDLHLITPKMAMHAEGRSANMPVALSLYQPAAGGRKGTMVEVHPSVAGPKGIKTGDQVILKSSVGSITAIAKVTELTRPDVLVLPFGQGHWAHGRWASKHGNGAHVDSITVQQSDRVSGMANYYSGKVTIERA